MTDEPMPQCDPEPDNPADWGHVRDALDTYIAPPAPDPKALIQALKPLVEARRLPSRHPIRTRALLRSQMLIFEPPFWLANALIFSIGLGVGWFGSAEAVSMLFTCIAPLLGVLGVGYVFRPSTEGLRELERISPISPLELLYARLLPVLCCNMLIVLGLLTTLALQTSEFALWRVLLVWLGPMLALSSLALFCAVKWGTIAGVAIPIGSWIVLLGIGQQPSFQSLSMTFDLVVGVRWWWHQANYSNWLLLGSGLAMLVSLLLFVETQRIFARSHPGMP